MGSASHHLSYSDFHPGRYESITLQYFHSG